MEADRFTDRGRVPPGGRPRRRWSSPAGLVIALVGLTAAAAIIAVSTQDASDGCTGLRHRAIEIASTGSSAPDHPAPFPSPRNLPRRLRPR